MPSTTLHCFSTSSKVKSIHLKCSRTATAESPRVHFFRLTRPPRLKCVTNWQKPNKKRRSEVPCDRKQPYNFKHNERVKSTNGHGSRSRRTEKKREEQFIHNIASWPEPKCIFGYQYQFDDIARFCSNPSIHCLLTNDTTFNLGNFCVTPTSYRNILLESNSTGKNPLSWIPFYCEFTFNCNFSFLNHCNFTLDCSFSSLDLTFRFLSRHAHLNILWNLRIINVLVVVVVHMTRWYAAYSHLFVKLKEEEPWWC